MPPMLSHLVCICFSPLEMLLSSSDSVMSAAANVDVGDVRLSPYELLTLMHTYVCMYVCACVQVLPTKHVACVAGSV